MAEFMALLDPVNAVADASPGFVWRLQTEEGNATALRPYEDDRMIVNMSVWESIEDLAAFVYRSGHVDVMRRRREWFEPMKPYMVLWWVPGRPRCPPWRRPRSASSTCATTARRPTPSPSRRASRRPTDADAEVDDELRCPA